ncbi:SUF system NifU family Fe-S cluster assembly protein [Acidobacteriia bacterium AH_259_A11_L15]|nr:SUF system NifU family Fe-S cluster assembly protein [Acidobacteriia bacterium AH_259_A11_L15]
MNDLRELYQEMIIDHGRRPRNFRALADADHDAQGFNPLCGDKVTVYLKLDDDTVRDISFQGSGCAISTASASLMTETLKGKTLAQAQALFEKFHRLVTGENEDAAAPELGKLTALGGVRDYPIRVKCATLAWHTLKAALKGYREVVSTE